MGDNISSGIKNALSLQKKGYRMSYDDILGESSRNLAQADFYYYEYLKAIKSIGSHMLEEKEIYAQPSISVKLSVRLVKGAYRDSKIKNAQEQGLEDYPVYTIKEFTDVSYLACAQKMLSNWKLIHSQFATHNAYTVAAIQEMAGELDFEFQKLHGMGAVLHEEIRKNGRKTRIYCPVEQYKDLLAYLIE